MTLLRKIFKFKELSELPFNKRKSLLEDMQLPKIIQDKNSSVNGTI